MLHQQIHHLRPYTRIVVRQQHSRQHQSGLRIGRELLQAIQSLQPDAGVGVVLQRVQQNVADVGRTALRFQQPHGLDADAGIGRVFRRGHQQPPDRLILHPPGQRAPARFLDHDLHLTRIARLHIPYARRHRVKDIRHAHGTAPRKQPWRCDSRTQEADRYQRDGAESRGQRRNRCEANGEHIAKVRPPAPMQTRLLLQPRARFQPHAGQHSVMDPHARRIQQVVHPSLAIHFRAARLAAIQMQFQPLFLIEPQLAVQIQRKHSCCFVAFHVKSPNAARIFCVARNRQFLAASSVVPSTSPMAFRRIPS